ncbi:hypothetical protein BG004_007685, partial [Podila humilis]
YDRLYFDPTKHQRIANLEGLWDRTITVGSGGKTFGTTGWRIGWLIGPKALVEPALAAHTRVVFCVNSPLQEAVAVGFEQADERGFFGSQIHEYQANRETSFNVPRTRSVLYSTRGILFYLGQHRSDPSPRQLPIPRFAP